MARYLLPPVLFFCSYYGGAPLVIAVGVMALAAFLSQRSYAASVIAAFLFATAGHVTAARDILPMKETHEVDTADSEVIRLENGTVLRHDGTVIPRKGDEIAFFDTAVMQDRGLPFLSSFEKVPDRGLRKQLNDLIRTRSDSTVLLALATGKRLFSADERAAFLKTGTMHVVAISAFHIGLLFLLLHFVTRLLAFSPAFSPRGALLLSIAIKSLVLFWYLSLTGWGAPTVRAALFLFLFDLFLVTGVPAHPFQMFLWSLIATAMILPRSMGSWSFIMSALSVFTVIMVWRRLSRSRIVSIVSLTVLINFFLLPVSAELSGFLPLLAPLANLIVIPFAGLVVLLLIPVQILFPFLPSVASFLLIPAEVAAHILTEDMRFLSVLSDPTLVPLRQAGAFWFAIFYGLAAAVIFLRGWQRRVALCALFLSSLPFVTAPFSENGVERIYSLPGNAYCIREGRGVGRVVETQRYNFPAEYVQRKLDALPMSIERDVSRCGLMSVSSLHLRGSIPSAARRDLAKRPRFRNASWHTVPEPSPLPSSEDRF